MKQLFGLRDEERQFERHGPAAGGPQLQATPAAGHEAGRPQSKFNRFDFAVLYGKGQRNSNTRARSEQDFYSALLPAAAAFPFTQNSLD
ncbi:hypothetical protein [Trichloromonas sp.]|uniref:hypothetical protein n=1 Tax=Trichloromonas sp. TaxID=3069249 RepID=UPI002A434203|nr:hypothetical protein [Trichloromonas sp.]